MKNRIIGLLLMLIIYHLASYAEDRIGNCKETDLGLSVNWSTCNIGAANSYDYGDCISWGDVSVNGLFFADKYRLANKRGKLIKYCFDRRLGKVDNKFVLDYSDDIAFLQLGSTWRIPTKEEFEELKENCFAKWVDNYDSTGISGMLFVSKINGNSIFLPACGFGTMGGVSPCRNVDGLYWTSTLDVFHSCTSYAYHFECRVQEITTFIRYNGCYVRPVKSK